MTETKKTKRTGGFNAMPPDQVKAITSAGGQAAQASGNAHQFTAEERAAGGKTAGSRASGKPRGFAAMPRERVSQIASAGGRAAHAKGTAHQFSAEEAREAGRKGGTAAHVSRGKRRPSTDASEP